MQKLGISRRRFLNIVAVTAGVAGVGLLPSWLNKAQGKSPAEALPAGTQLEPVSWQGIALGADAQLHIYHEDKQLAQRLIERMLAEVSRLERIFSLYQEDSALSRLNAQGYLENPPKELLDLLSRSQYFSDLSDGLFDPGVQVLWNLYAKHLADRKNVALPSKEALAQTLKLIDYRQISLDIQRISLNIPGMQLTLNGIAQGYITDRVTELLREAGMQKVLVDMGEVRGLELLQNTDPWKVGIRSPKDDNALLTRVDLRNEAIATSAGSGTPLDEEGTVHHLFNPKTGYSPKLYQSVSVMAKDATTADALSTTFSLMPIEQIKRIQEQIPETKVYLFLPDNTLTVM